MAKSKPFKFILDNNKCLNLVSHKTCRFGYPILSIKSTVTHGHRYVWIKNFGVPAKGLVIRHKCDNPKCVNISHLELGTIQDNVKDRHERGRTSHASRTPGEINGMSKLNESQVIEIRNLYASGNYSQSQIGIMFGIKQTTVGAIIRKQAWKHVGGGL